jgi:hypothetical protein
MIELECLSAAWAIHKCRKFSEELPHFELVTDHRPLIPILNDYSLDKLDNPLILRIRLKMQRYQFTARWVRGKENLEADALSRAPVDIAFPDDELAEGPHSFSARAAIISTIKGSDVSVADPVLDRIKTAALEDKQMIELRDAIINGFPNDKCNLSLSLRPFWNIRTQLAIDESDGMIMAGARIVIPESCRRPILQDLIQMHQGATKLKQRAILSIYWPGMDNDIDMAAQSCKHCTENQPWLPREPLQQRKAATHPFEQIHMDIASVNGRDFLILVDQYSGWPDVIPFKNKNTTARRIVDAYREFFAAASPAQMVLNRPVRDALPAHRRSFAPEWQQKTDVLAKRARRAKDIQIEHYNKTAHQFPPFSIGDHVIIQHHISKCWSTPAVVVEIGPNRDYLLKTPAG